MKCRMVKINEPKLENCAPFENVRNEYEHDGKQDANTYTRVTGKKILPGTNGDGILDTCKRVKGAHNLTKCPNKCAYMMAIKNGQNDTVKPKRNVVVTRYARV